MFTYNTIVMELLEEVPEYREVYRQKLEYYGEVDPYMMFGMPLLRFTLDAFQHAETDHDAKELLIRTLAFIERAANSEDDDVATMIHTGFMEIVAYAKEDYAEFVKYFGPTSVKMLKKINPHRWR